MDKLEQIFEPLFCTKSFGTGLELAIVERIMKQHGGAVKIESKASEGTRMSLLLPDPGEKWSV
jgi:signal transduction histidine kinase